MPAKIELDLLIREASETATMRGHRIGHTRYHDFTRASATCRDCGKEIYVIRNPAPNEINISGEALAVTCPKEESHV